MHRVAPLLLLMAAAASAQKYDGPPPPRADVPYIKQATNLIATEVAQAKEDKRSTETAYIVDGANSTAKTPLSLPVFILKTSKVAPEKLILYKLESKDGHREVVLSTKNPPDAFHMEVSRLPGENLYKIEVADTLDTGEYILRQEGSAQVFCFQVY
jgi:hypothetical protein